jgi:hypothetical protein
MLDAAGKAVKIATGDGEFKKTVRIDRRIAKRRCGEAERPLIGSRLDNRDPACERRGQSGAGESDG